MLETFRSMHKLLRITCWSLVFCISPLLAQRNCGTQLIDSLKRIKNPNLETKDGFEKWMGNQLLRKSSNANRTQSTFIIPIVVHIVHNGEPIGTGLNISDAQVQSQINVLNKDYQRLNADAGQTPAEFQGVAGSLAIQFVLAKQDPDGNPTTGIVRVNGGRSAWNLYQDAELKAKSYWPAENYFNVWVTSIVDYLGYSTFPVSNLAGVENSPQDRLTDGVMVHYRCFGSSADGSFDLDPQFNSGRTLTHESGHFLGLRHIWGDVNSCSGSGDYVDDTPFQSASTSGCPAQPQSSCGRHKMFQNYMDYTDDLCMNLFTVGQFARVQTVLLNSPRRASLLTSTGASLPGTYALDLGIVKAIEPTTLECSGSHTPTLTIRNFGTTTITSATIEMKINGFTAQTIAPILTLGSLQQTNVTFPNYTSVAGDLKNYSFNILNVNAQMDEYAGNNSLTVSSKTASNASLPFLETFDSNLNNWSIVNPDGLITWQQSGPVTSGKALTINLYNYENEGSVDRVFSPRIDLSTATGLLLKFKYAYAHASGYDGDALYVYAQTGCADDLDNATRIFAKEGKALATTSSATGGEFTPSANEWKTQVIPLQSFVGSASMRVIFASRNGFGNNIFVDSVKLVGGDVRDLVLQEVLQPSNAVCVENTVPKLLLFNQGSKTVNGFSVDVYRDNELLETQQFNDVIESGMESVVALSSLTLSAGLNSLRFTVTPNLLIDDIPSNNSKDWPVVKISKQEKIPVREDFTTSSWHFVANSTANWSLQNTNYGQSALFNSFEDDFGEVGEIASIVSSRLDFSKALEASMFVDFSYATNPGRDEHIAIKVSENCGETFPFTKFESQASAIATKESTSSWLPAKETDWSRQYVNLDNFIGQDDILIAIEATNDNGNNLYVDNIEFFENDNSSPTRITEQFRVYSNESLTQTFLTFNLEEQQPAEVVVANMMGASIANVSVDNALNQTLTFQLNVAPGIYIFRVRLGSRWYAVKQFIGY